MSKFVVSATVNDPNYVGGHSAKFSYRILDNKNYTIDEHGGVDARNGYTPQVGDVITVEVSYEDKHGCISTATKKFTVKI